jgi:hypothetical protein
MVDWDEFEEGSDEEYEEYGRDEAIDAAKDTLLKFFQNPQERKTVFYVMQLQVMFERKHYHWITYKAIDELVDEGRLADDIKPLIEEDEPRPGSPKVRFIFHPSCRSTIRQIDRKLTLIRSFSAEDVSRGAGRIAEILFSRGLMMNGFRYVGENLREYRDRKWEISNSDLDYIFERNDRAYGCEIKNRFGYMKREDITEKIRICRHLGVTPLFIVRMAPKSYIDWVRTTDPPGFTLIFETHIYSEGHRPLVEKIQRELKGLPVDCPRDLPGSIINRFLKWHLKQIGAAT